MTVDDKLNNMLAECIAMVTMFNKSGNFVAATQFQSLLQQIQHCQEQVRGAGADGVRAPGK